jgi:hypothetical protein
VSSYIACWRPEKGAEVRRKRGFKTAAEAHEYAGSQPHVGTCVLEFRVDRVVGDDLRLRITMRKVEV